MIVLDLLAKTKLAETYYLLDWIGLIIYVFYKAK